MTEIKTPFNIPTMADATTSPVVTANDPVVTAAVITANMPPQPPIAVPFVPAPMHPAMRIPAMWDIKPGVDCNDFYALNNITGTVFEGSSADFSNMLRGL